MVGEEEEEVCKNSVWWGLEAMEERGYVRRGGGSKPLRGWVFKNISVKVDSQ